LIIAGASFIFITVAYYYRDKWLEALKKRHIISENPQKPHPDQNQRENQEKPQS